MPNFITITEIESFLGVVKKKKVSIDAGTIKKVEAIKNEKYKSRITMNGALGNYYLVGETQKRIMDMIENKVSSKTKREVKKVKK